MLLDIVGLRVQLGDHLAIHNLSLQLAPGERVALVGGSGCGKTTTARAILGLLPSAQVTAQRMCLNGLDLTNASAGQWRRVRGGQIALVLQDSLGALDPLQRVGSAIAEVLVLHRSLSRAQTVHEIDELLRAVQLDPGDGIASAYPHQLSGGQRQRVGLALALAGRPQLLIADEPSSALDGDRTRNLAELLRSLCQGRPGWPQMALLLISHDLRLVAATCQRALVLHHGVVVQEGPVAEILAQPQHDATQALVAQAGLDVERA